MEFIKEAGVSPQKSMDIKNDKITIKPLRDKDVDIFSKWLAKEYIYKWFCPDGSNGDSWLPRSALQCYIHSNNYGCHCRSEGPTEPEAIVPAWGESYSR